MKRIIIYIFILSFIFISCKKDKQETVDSPVVGGWTWIKSVSFYNGDTITPQSTGKSWYLSINANHDYSENGTLYGESTGTYNLSSSNDMDYLHIIFSNGSEKEAYYKLLTGSRDTLFFNGGPAADVQQDYFVRALTF